MPKIIRGSKKSGAAPHVSVQPRRRAVFTIVSTNYIGYAATLMQSAAVHMPGVERFIILSDVRRAFDDVDLSATLLDCDELHIEFVNNMKMWYTVIEFNTAIKPYAFLYFFEHRGFDEACYIDPDILLFSELTEVFTALQDHSCVLTPHMMDPLQDGKEPSDLTIMKSGVYNLGFLGLRNDQDGCRLARWWADRCFLDCRVDIAGNMFTDQRWMDLAPAFVSRPYILRHPGYNIAYWNLLHRKVHKTDDGEWRVNDERLVFFHFSGIAPDKPNQFSKHQNRYTPENLGPAVNELCDLYRGRVLANHWQDYSKIAYGFGAFPDGRRIDDIMRHCIARTIGEGVIDPKGPLEIRSDFFDQVDTVAGERGVVIIRYMYQLWLERKDLRAAFDIFNPDGLKGYYTWFLGGDAAAQGVDALTLNAAQDVWQGNDPGAKPAWIPLQLPPWPRVSVEVWADRSADVFTGLATDLPLDLGGSIISMPKQIALLWERRRDLQSAFDLAVHERRGNYLCWALTNGIRDGVVDPAFLSESFIEGFLRTSSVSAFYGDVPITEGMLLLRQVGEERKYVPGWNRFPTERSGRLAHGLWFAFIAPKLFGWPARFVAPVRRYFLELTPTSVDGFRLSRAALAVWELRPDLQKTFSLGDGLSVWRYLRWLLIDGLRELGLTIDEFDPRLRQFLVGSSPRFPDLTQILEMLHDYRQDLRESFDLNVPGKRQELLAWADQNILSATLAHPMGEALRNPPPLAAPATPRVVHRASIALTGYWAEPTGLGEVVRGSACGLDAVGFTDYVVVDIVSKSIILPDGKVLSPGVQVEVDVNVVHTNADTASEDALSLRRLGVHSKKAIGFWHWELEWLPDYWRYAYSYYDEIWASTKFGQAAFNVDALRPVKLVPITVTEPEIEVDLTRTELGLPERATIFLFMFDFRSYATRKNPEAVVRAFRAAFPAGDEAAYLLIKSSGAAAMAADAAALRQLAADPRIELRDSRMERAELLNIIRSADAFVSLHRSEGFGRGPAEAMLLGVPAIVTDYSGTADYATPDTALLVDYELTPVAESDYPGVVGQRWADANVATAARHMRWVYEHAAESRVLGQRGRAQIISMYNPRLVGEALLKKLGLAKNVIDAEESSVLKDAALTDPVQ